MKHETYLEKANSLTIEKARRATGACTPKAVSQHRGSLVVLQWPAAVGKSHEQDMLEANKLLRLAKSNANLDLHYEGAGPSPSI